MTPETPFGISAIRELARRRSEQSSLRSIAAEIPMSLTALRHFLAGGRPQPATIAKLVAWSTETRHGGVDAVPDEDVDAAIALLRLYISRGRSPKDIEKRRASVVALL